MAIEAVHPDARGQARRWIADYRARAGSDDLLVTGDVQAWETMLADLAATAGGDLGHARERVRRHAADIVTGFRIAGDAEARPWPVSPVPLMIPAAEWAGIEAGVVQRAELLELIVADLYGEARLVTEGGLPAAVVTGSPLFLRPMVGLPPPGGRHLHFLAFDLGRDPGGGWRVLADHARAPAGAGHALENRLAVARTLAGSQDRLGVQRHAPFFAAFRAGLAAGCRRADPRIGLLTPGRFNASYAEQAHLARYLGLLLVEGADLAALDGLVYLRTIGGLKRIDALWRRVDPRLLDPLAFDSHSAIGVAGLIDAYAAGNVVIANAPGAGVVEAPALAAFLPALAAARGEPLCLPNVATWWCGQDDARLFVERALDALVIAPAFGSSPLGLPQGTAIAGGALSADQRAVLIADLARRPQDYVGREAVRLSTMPVVIGDRLEPRAFTLRVFAARDAGGGWVVMPGGFARIGEHPAIEAASVGEGRWSADVSIHGGEPARSETLIPAADAVRLRRNTGTLPSRVADNFFWLGRYLERGEALLGAVRVLLGHSIDGGAALPADTVARLVGLVAGVGAAPQPAATLDRGALTGFARAALDGDGTDTVAAINARACDIGAVSRDRLSADMLRLLDAPFPTTSGLLDRAGALQRRYAALAGLFAEHMVRSAAWRFLDLGRRVERIVTVARTARVFGMEGASTDDLTTLLDLGDGQISYRQRYPTGMARVPAIDLVVLDPGNPRSLAFQAARIVEHLAVLPVLTDDGMAEPQQARARTVAARLAEVEADHVDADLLGSVERDAVALSDAIARRYFLQGAEPLRADALTLA